MYTVLLKYSVMYIMQLSLDYQDSKGASKIVQGIEEE